MRHPRPRTGRNDAPLELRRLGVVRWFAIGVSCIATACESSEAPAFGATTTSTTQIDSSGVVTTGSGSSSIEIDSGIQFVSTSKSGFGEADGVTQTVNGSPYGVRHGRLFIGEHDFGVVPPDAKVRLSLEGVYVDGERRGEMPVAPIDDEH